VCTSGTPGRADWNGYRFEFVRCPLRLRQAEEKYFGTVPREIEQQVVCVTGPERTLVDCMAVPRRAGGPEEALVSLRGVTVLKFEILEKYLDMLGNARVYAAVGAFLEQEAQRLFVPVSLLKRLEERCPRSKTYFSRSAGAGRYLRRWNLLVPEAFLRKEDDFEA